MMGIYIQYTIYIQLQSLPKYKVIKKIFEHILLNHLNISYRVFELQRIAPGLYKGVYQKKFQLKTLAKGKPKMKKKIIFALQVDVYHLKQR